MITEDYVSFEIAKLLKEKGFECEKKSITAMYNENGKFHSLSTAADEYYDYNDFDEYDYIAPTLQMAMKWLRKKHRLHIDIDPSESDWNPTVITLEDWTCIVKYGDKIPVQDTYEEACEAAIKYCLENLI